MTDMAGKRIFAVLLTLCLVLGFGVPSISVYAQADDPADSCAATDELSGGDLAISDEQTGIFELSTQSEPEDIPEQFELPKASVSEFEDTVETVDMTVEEYLELKKTDGINGSRYYVDGRVSRGEDDPLVSAEGNGTYRYSKLNAAEKKVHDALIAELEEFRTSDLYLTDVAGDFYLEAVVTLTGEEMSGGCDLVKVHNAVYHEAFSYYWMSLNYSISSFSNGVSVRVGIDPYYLSAASRLDADRALAELVDEWYGELYAVREAAGSADADYLAALRLHDLIIMRVNYAYDEKGEPQSQRWAHSVAGIGTGQGVVCEGYAKMYSYMLNIMGIDNIYLVGDTPEGRHAWNAVYLDGNEAAAGYYLCDATWDDTNAKETTGLHKILYEYFCLPADAFGKMHKPEEPGLPQFSNNDDYTYYKYFSCGSDIALTRESAKTLRDAAFASQYEYADYVQFKVPDYASAELLREAVGKPADSMYGIQGGGVLAFYESVHIEAPATQVTITDCGTAEAVTAAAVKVRETVDFKALLPEGSDDRVKWSVTDSRVASITSDDRTVTVKGKRNGIVTLAAVTYAGKAEYEVGIVVGDGPLVADIYVWAGGSTSYKKATVTPDISATVWTDARGRSKQGKLVWLASDTRIDVVFDTTRHTVVSRPTKTLISVDSKGVVTAKKPGLAYVYVCDTGSCTFEEYSVGVRLAPEKITATARPDSFAKADVYKTVNINTGYSGKLYIAASSKLGECDADCTYTVSLAKEEQSKYITLFTPEEDDDGNKYFKVNVKNFDTDKLKVVTVKVNIVNNESGKKSSVTIKIGNPVETVDVTVGEAVSEKNTEGLASKNNTVVLKLNLVTAAFPAGTTDKLKLYVGKTTVSLKPNGKSVQKDSGATVSATIVKDSTQGSRTDVLLKAKKDAAEPAVVFAALTDAVTKEVKLFRIADVDEKGIVTIPGE